MAEFRLTPAALRDMEGIWRYSVAQWGTARAERYLDALNTSFKALAAAPHLGRACDDIRPGYRCQRVEHHTAYFRVEKAMVIVVRVLHERMDAPRHL